MPKKASRPSSPTINDQIVGGISVGKQELRTGETVVADIPANRRQFGILYGGRLVLTNQRLVFLPGKSGSQRTNASVELKSLAAVGEKRLRLAVVLGSKSALPRFSIPAVAVETTTGHTYEFELGEIRTGDRARWMRMLIEAVPNTASGHARARA